MRLSFTDVTSGPAYQKEASAASKVSIVVATGICIFIIFFKDWGFGYWWLLIIPVLWFLASLVLAMPITLVRFWIASKLSENPSKSRLATGLVDIASLPVEILLVYFSLKYLHSSLWS
jgi:hypothetical protein